jgi:hypothetical protein
MDNLNKIYSSIPVLERNKRLKLSRQKRFDVYYCLAFMFGFAGLFLWWGSHAFFNVFTDLLTPPEKLESANNIINQWNVLMYFVPYSFLAFHWLSGNGFTGVLIAELAFGLNMPLKKASRDI